MGLEKAIEHGKEHRKLYHGSKAYDSWCRNHGKCVWCRLGRQHKKKVEEQRAKDREIDDE